MSSIVLFSNQPYRNPPIIIAFIERERERESDERKREEFVVTLNYKDSVNQLLSRLVIFAFLSSIFKI